MPVHISTGELIRRTFRETIDDDCLGLAAQLSYYLFLALFPAILFLLAVASFFPIHNLTDEIGTALGPFVSAEVLQLIQDQMQRLANADSGGLLTFGFFSALWSSSAGLVAIVSSLNRAYDIVEGRPWWRVRLVAIALTLGMAVFVLLALALVVGGPALARYLGDTVGLGAGFKWAWLILQWPLAFAMVSTAIGLAYYFGPDAEQEWAWVNPGAIVATVLWLVVSLAFKFYVARFTDYNASYGAVGGVMVLMLWFYVSGLAILVGAELNSEIEHSSPYGKAPEQKTAAGRRLLGHLAELEFQKTQGAQPSAVVLPRPGPARPGRIFVRGRGPDGERVFSEDETRHLQPGRNATQRHGDHGMAENADPSVNATPSNDPALAAPVAALKIATRRTRERMTANLNALEHKVRHAVGGQSRDGAASGRIRLLTATSAVATVRRLRAMPLKTAVAIGVVAAAVIAMRARLSER